MILGIDLGTTYSAVAVADDSGRPQVLPNRLGELTTPSCASFLGPNEVVVGSMAKERRSIDPDNTVSLIKRQMGVDYPLAFHGVNHTPESVSALLLRALVDDAAAELGALTGDPVRAVITVPAYFGLREREATQQAAEMAGIEVLELVAEPVAAALHYGVADTSDRTILVYDLGGGTFDCTVLRSASGSVTVLATDGDSHLGGAEVDERLADALLERLAEELPDDAGHPADDAAMVQEAMSLAEIAKRNLSGRQSHRVTLRHGGHILRMEVDREMIATVSRDMIERTMTIVERLVTTVGRAVHIDDVVLVGGSSRLPAVTEALATRFGRTPLMTDPELAVALGAAVRADRLTRKPVSGGITAVSTHAVAVLPRGVGVLVRDSNDPAGLREFVQHVVAANTQLPATATAPFATILDKQSSVRIQVFEQAGALVSEELGHNRRVLDGEFTGLPDLPAGARVDVTVSVGTDGRLAVTAREVLGGTTLCLEAYVEGVIDAVAAEQLSATTSAMVIRQ
ncbi:MAG: Hsp70 family protein [Pseudonocardia sp.]